MAGEDPKYLAYLRTLPCSVPECGGSPVQAHHATGAGMGTRHHDHKAMPLCWAHHAAFHDLNGYFKGWTKDRRRAWQQEQIARLRAPRDPEAF